MAAPSLYVLIIIDFSEGEKRLGAEQLYARPVERVGGLALTNITPGEDNKISRARTS